MQPCRIDSQADEYDEEEYDDEDDKDSNSSDTNKFEDEYLDKPSKSTSKKVQGIPIKDLDSRKEVFSFIAYP